MSSCWLLKEGMAAPREVAAELQYGPRGVAFFLTGLGGGSSRGQERREAGGAGGGREGAGGGREGGHRLRLCDSNSLMDNTNCVPQPCLLKS